MLNLANHKNVLPRQQSRKQPQMQLRPCTYSQGNMGKFEGDYMWGGKKRRAEFYARCPPTKSPFKILMKGERERI